MHGRNLKLWSARAMVVVAVASLTLVLGGCSTWVDPTTWFESDAPSAESSPELSGLPAKPAVAPAASENQKIVESLDADLKNAKRSGEVLRGGAESAAPPPPSAPPAAASTAVPSVVAVPSVAGQSPAAAPKPPVAPEPPKSDSGAKDNSFTPPPSGTSPPGTLPDVSLLTMPRTIGARFVVSRTRIGEDPQPAAPQVRVAELPAGTLPVTPADPGAKAQSHARARDAVQSGPAVGGGDVPQVSRSEANRSAAAAQRNVAPVVPAQTVEPADASLGFQPSSAPPLDPSITDFVPQQIVQNYRNAFGQPSATISPRKGAGMDAKSRKSGAKSQPAAPVTDCADTTGGGAGFVPPVGNADAIVFFADNAADVDGDGMKLVRKLAKAYRAQGGQGVVRVIGHASSRTKDMPVGRHLETNYAISKKRADAVAQALARAGVPANMIRVEAVSDSQPIFYESMPKGEVGNRRVEVFLQH